MISLSRTGLTTKRVLQQLQHDPRTLALLIMVPLLLLTVLKLVYDGQPRLFAGAAPMLLGIFPMSMMFLITSIATLRERTSGTLDRLMTQPISKLDFIFGYAAAFTIVGLLQAVVATAFAIYVLDVNVAAGFGYVLFTAFVTSFLGSALGLFVSAFARSEFQAVQLVMPILMPQILMSGLFTPRDQMHPALEFISGLMPLTYSVDAMRQVASSASIDGEYWTDIAIVLAIGIAVLFIGTITIKRHER